MVDAPFFVSGAISEDDACAFCPLLPPLESTAIGNQR